MDANSFDTGSGVIKFRTRKEMYDWMVENGHSFTDESGDEGPKFKAHVDKRVAKDPNDSKAAKIKTQLEA